MIKAGSLKQNNNMKLKHITIAIIGILSVSCSKTEEMPLLVYEEIKVAEREYYTVEIDIKKSTPYALETKNIQSSPHNKFVYPENSTGGGSNKICSIQSFDLQTNYFVSLPKYNQQTLRISFQAVVGEEYIIRLYEVRMN